MKPKLTHLECEVVIKAPREKIYEIMTDFENLPKYFPAVAKSAKIVSRDGNNFVCEAETKSFFINPTFHVHMEGTLQPPTGFISTNTTVIDIEHEKFSMEEIPGGTKIHYVNDVELTHPIFRLFGDFFIKNLALWYWKKSVFGELKKLVEK